MQLPSQIYEFLKPAIIYLNTHPIAHYSLILVTFLLLSLLISGLGQKTKTAATKSKSIKHKKLHRDDDIHFIAGDDIIATQLDLAKAYMEMDHKMLAKKILLDVIKQGSAIQKTQAHQLLEAL